MSAPRPTLGEALIHRLADHGVDTVFGIPGVHTLALYRGLAASSIRHVTPRHEQGAGFMADGYARAGGRPGVCVLTSGPGLTNAATALGEAYSDSSPVLALSSVAARADLGLGLGRLHELQNQSAATAPLVGWSRTALTPGAAMTLLDRAFAGFAAGRPRPVHIEAPLDVLEEEAPAPAPFSAPSRPGPDPGAIERAARLCHAARHPVLLLGGGAVEAGEAALRLARRIGAVIVSTLAGSGVAPADDPLSLGACLASAAGRAALAEADLVLAVGTELAETDHWTERLPIAGALVRVDIDLAELTDHPAAIALQSDAQLALEALADAAPRRSDGSAEERAARWRRAIREELEATLAERLPLVDAMRASLPREAIFVGDMTRLAYAANVAFPSYRPRSHLHPSGYGTLGFALPAAIGAALACPDQPVVAVMGDGGFQFTLAELGAAAELGLRLTLVVYDNGGYGMIEEGMRRANIRPIGVTPAGPDIETLARAYGVPCARARGPQDFAAALRTDLAREGVGVVHLAAD